MAILFHVGDGYFVVGAKFDSRRRYIRAVANPADKTINMCRGPSVSIATTVNGQAAWRWQCNASTLTSLNTTVTPPGPGFNTGLNVTI